MSIFASDGNTANPRLIEPLRGLFTNVGDGLAALVDQALDLQACGCTDHAGDRQRAGAVAPQFRRSGRAGRARRGAEAGHAVELGKGPQDDHILVGRDQGRGRLGGLRQMDICLIQEDDRILRLVGDQVFDVFLGSDRTGRIVRDCRRRSTRRWGRPGPSRARRGRSPCGAEP